MICVQAWCNDNIRVVVAHGVVREVTYPDAWNRRENNTAYDNTYSALCHFNTAYT